MKADRRCSFCGKKESDVKRLVAGGDPRGVAICDGCIALLCRDQEVWEPRQR